MKTKRVVLAIIAIVMAMTSLFAFAACDDKDDNNTPLTFDEGTTAEDIIALIDSGKIHSCTIKMGARLGDENESYYLRDGYQMTMKITNNFVENILMYLADENNEYSDWRGHNFVKIDGENCYVISDYGDDYDVFDMSDEIEQMRFQINQSWSVIKEMLSNEDLSISVLSDKVIIINENFEAKDSLSWSHLEAPYVEIFDFNSTTITLPEELANYKELAVKPSEE